MSERFKDATPLECRSQDFPEEVGLHVSVEAGGYFIEIRETYDDFDDPTLDDGILLRVGDARALRDWLNEVLP